MKGETVAPRVPHQLSIHLDHEPVDGGSEVTVVWSYPHAGEFSISERRVKRLVSDLPDHVRSALGEILDQLRLEIRPSDVRLPSRTEQTRVREAITTVVLQDRQRTDTPKARMYYVEVLEATGVQVEREITLSETDFTGNVLESWERLRKWAKRVAWSDYNALFEP